MPDRQSTQRQSTQRRFMQREHVNDIVRSAYGSDRRLIDIDRLTGGTKKGVYRLTLDDGTSAILYAWNDEENYWPAANIEPDDPFADASGADLLLAAHARLQAAGVRVPALLRIDRTRSLYPADLVLAEDVRGGRLEALIERSPGAALAPLGHVGRALTAMNQHRSTAVGKVALVEAGSAPQDRRPERIVLDRALRHLDIVAGRVGALATARDRIEARVRELATVTPREDYALIHGELGPDHFLMDDAGTPVMIDIEGVMFFDVEWEHAFVRMRFGDSYPRLGLDLDLDPARMAFYELAQSLSLVEGPLRIADGDFPDRDFMLGIATWHTGKVLRLAS